MATWNIPKSFTDGVASSAPDVNTNFTNLKTFIEAIAAGTNIDAGAITYSHLLAATITSLTTTITAGAADDAGVVIGSQVFG